MNQLYIVIGAFGSGKSEYSINLARELKDKGYKVALADLDVVNPYFRSRDVKEEFADLGIEVVSPEGALAHADLPMISPKVRGIINDPSKTVILDVGGDPAGCRALGRFVDEIRQRGYLMHLVINTKRPFTQDVKGILEIKRSLEAMSELSISEFVCNTNLMEHTDLEIITQGIETVEEAAKQCATMFNEFLVMKRYSKLMPDSILGKQKRVLIHYLRKPWEV
ncbi:MAG: hypothetical protein K8S56_07375 [Candidatus Cloacimonetes bacterium]|nr:hypothetical protein [Candidatus Cloacimonadota bacterium]